MNHHGQDSIRKVVVYSDTQFPVKLFDEEVPIQAENELRPYHFANLCRAFFSMLLLIP